MDLELIETFKSQIIKKEDSDCQIIKNKNPNFYFKCKKYRSARLSYQINIGEIPPRNFIVTTCSNHLCVNPKHLRLITLKEKMEKIFKSSNWAKKGRKLTPEQIARISKTHKGKKMSPELRERLRKANLGNKHSLETKIKMSRTRTGKKMPEGTGEKVAFTKQGEKNYNAKLTKKDILKIRSLANQATRSDLARAFGVSPSHILSYY